MNKYIKRFWFSLLTPIMMAWLGLIGIWELWVHGAGDHDRWDFWNK